MKRIEANYKTYADSHVELARTKIENEKLAKKLADERKEKDLICKS